MRVDLCGRDRVLRMDEDEDDEVLDTTSDIQMVAFPPPPPPTEHLVSTSMFLEEGRSTTLVKQGQPTDRSCAISGSEDLTVALIISD